MILRQYHHLYQSNKTTATTPPGPPSSATATVAAIDLVSPELDNNSTSSSSIHLANELDKLLQTPQHQAMNAADAISKLDDIDETLAASKSSKRYVDALPATSVVSSSAAFIKDEFKQLRDALEENADYHNKTEKRCESVDGPSIVIERQGGLANKFVLFLLLLWYLMSAFTLYSNKHIVSSKIADPTLIGKIQLHQIEMQLSLSGLNFFTDFLMVRLFK